MNVRERWKEIALLNNEHELNQAALPFLDPESKDQYRLHVLSLALWGVENGLAGLNVGAQVEELVRGDPNDALAFIAGDSLREWCLYSEDVENCEDSREAAFRVLEAIAVSMRETRERAWRELDG